MTGDARPFPSRGVVSVAPEDGGWTVAEHIGGTCLTFDTRREAEEYATGLRAYVARWGYANLCSAPYDLDSPPVPFTAEHVAAAALPGVLATLARRRVPGFLAGRP